MSIYWLLVIAAWLWLCLVMLPENHFRIAVFGVPLIAFGFVCECGERFFGKLKKSTVTVGKFIGRFGHDKDSK